MNFDVLEQETHQTHNFRSAMMMLVVLVLVGLRSIPSVTVSNQLMLIVTSNYPQLEVSYDVEWRSLNYAISSGVILAHSDIKLIPKT